MHDLINYVIRSNEMHCQAENRPKPVSQGSKAPCTEPSEDSAEKGEQCAMAASSFSECHWRV